MMRRIVALALLATLLAPIAHAQFTSEARTFPSEATMIIGGGVHVDYSIPNARNVHISSQFLVAGVDNRMNLTVRNMQDTWWNATFEIVNVSGATVTSEGLAFNVPPFGTQGIHFVIHPDEPGAVRFVAHSVDAHLPQTGEPAHVEGSLWAVPPVSIRWIDPALMPTQYEENGIIYELHGPPYLARMRPTDTFIPRLEVANPLETALQPFEVEVRVQGKLLGRLPVPALEARETRVLEFQEFVPPLEEYGGRFYPGMQLTFQLELTVRFTIGGLVTETSGASFALRNGAVEDLIPTVGVIEVRDGVAVQVLAPQEATLGVPTRIRVNVTNFAAKAETGQIALSIQSPYGLHYGVQGTESRTISVALQPLESSSRVFEFTPRVTGSWNIDARYHSGEGVMFGLGGASMRVPSPLTITIDQLGTVYARLNEPVRVDLAIESTETLPDARIEVAAISQGFYYRESPLVGDTRQGLAHRLVSATNAGASNLGTLRSGGTVNTTFEIVSGASGRYTVVPYVLSEGFAYTDGGSSEPGYMPFPGVRISSPSPGYPGEFPGMRSSTFDLAVQPRALPSALALAPLTLGLVVFVGTWTLRTRFVR